MPRLTLWLAVALVAAGPSAVAAQCKQGEDQWDTSQNGCIECTADKQRCQRCAEKWVLTAQGQCARCNATHIGDWQESCVSCRADDPTICLKCTDYCNTSGCTGYFVTREGHCSRCPEGAAACSDLTGEVQECRSGRWSDGLGLVGGECRPCKIQGCQKCDNDLWTCTKCFVQVSSYEDGYFPDASTGTCARCDKGCRACTGPGACLECALTVLNPVTKTCPPCNVANCYQCLESLDKCGVCDEGFYLVEANNTCVPCGVANCLSCGVANCLSCANGTSCRACIPGYGLTNPQGGDFDTAATACHACTKADPNCLACDGDPAVCSQCAEGMAPDPGTGLCTLCQLANARTTSTCSVKDATRCDTDYDYQCADGFYCRNVTGQCTACPMTGCKNCDRQEPQRCNDCLPGYWDAARPINEQRYRASPVADSHKRWASVQQVPTECKPCDDNNCLACTVSLGAACERCADGYFLDRATKRCRECTEPDGALYETCAPAPAAASAPAPAPAAA